MASVALGAVTGMRSSCAAHLMMCLPGWNETMMLLYWPTSCARFLMKLKLLFCQMSDNPSSYRTDLIIVEGSIWLLNAPLCLPSPHYVCQSAHLALGRKFTVVFENFLLLKNS